MSLLTLDGVACRRGGRLLFEGLSLALLPGEAIHLTGPNGVGKSSLLRLVAGLLAPAAGSVTTAPLALADDRPALDPELPLASALGFWSDAQAAAEGLRALGLEPLADVPVRLLSSGQQRRAGLARVAASGARLWLLDEPLNALDSTSTALLGTAIARHREGGGAVLAASHQPLPGEGWRELSLGA